MLSYMHSTQGSLYRNLLGFREFVEKPARRRLATQLASFWLELLAPDQEDMSSCVDRLGALTEGGKTQVFPQW